MKGNEGGPKQFKKCELISAQCLRPLTIVEVKIYSSNSLLVLLQRKLQ